MTQGIGPSNRPQPHNNIEPKENSTSQKAFKLSRYGEAEKEAKNAYENMARLVDELASSTPAVRQQARQKLHDHLSALIDKMALLNHMVNSAPPPGWDNTSINKFIHEVRTFDEECLSGKFVGEFSDSVVKIKAQKITLEAEMIFRSIDK